MAEPDNPTDPSSEAPKPEESQPTPAPADSPEAEKKVATPKADAAKPAKKPARQKKEQPTPVTATPENLSLSSDDVEKPKVV